jgi:hypothetical protein
MTANAEFLIRRDDLHRTEWFDLPDPAKVELGTGQLILGVDAFALTANNVTYAVFGDAMQYWNFFPAREGYGTVPVWGFANVLRSNNPAVKEGERFYGYLPMSSYFVATAEASGGGFTEVSPHRRDLPPIYNQYLRSSTDPGYDADREPEQMLMRPLFLTGWLIDDFLADNDFFGARSVVVSSASSKTSIGLAFNLSRRGEHECEVIGLTSHHNRSFVESLEIYHRVTAYEEIAALPAVPTVFVDMAGDTAVTSAVHQHFGEALRYSCSVGGTHWSNLAFGASFPGPTPTLFFAPSQVEKRNKDWGAAELQRRMGEAWTAFLPNVDGWMVIDRRRGRDEIERVWLETVDGKANPKHGYILGL